MQRGDRHFTLPLSRPRDRGGLTTDEESLAFGHGRRRVAHDRLPLYDVSNGRASYSTQGGQGYQFRYVWWTLCKGECMQRPSIDYVRGDMVTLGGRGTPHPPNGASNALGHGGGGGSSSVAELLDYLYVVVRCYSFTPETR